MAVHLNAPNAPTFSPAFELEGLMGTWHVTHSTLPLWKVSLPSTQPRVPISALSRPRQDKKDVTISYAPITTTPGPSPSSPSSSAPRPTRINDLVEYRSIAASASSRPSRVLGVDTLDPASPTRFKWRGKGLLIIASSRWHLLGYHSPVPSPSPSPGTGPDPTVAADAPPSWAVTFFEKTLFTPAGLDIYARAPEGLPADLHAAIVRALHALGGEVADLAASLFEVQRSAA
ncbi:hypothetical protein HETIRDRAFT_427868 [Heterobasidion irregulare TC 32-1]|uniref:Uncharacterized protein n=1 Tax=Heterobasidion irregulare (strain TC 32-1) TaxID=747525 RepID=W4K5L9_HETIT|nr:uncharacterized protein HETIRDRAFT_427868 [Heterobasidion irregulare TC 32-1]ETW81059.1 hypothetical protein HETIRDRAFT_427868 [Heterobasidion irregulare TC 32-1]